MTILGIDLGTTNSACAVWKNSKSTLIPNRLGHFITPSVVSLDDDENLIVGSIAKNRLVMHPNSSAAVFKRHMGTSHPVKLKTKPFSAIELSSMILKSLKEDAETFLNEDITEAVISVPAYFNDLQRQATKAAGELISLKIERLINEPTAAAMVHGLHNRENGTKFIILDLGGGTFDVSLVEYFDGVIEVHASSGDNHLGGEDFLNLLVNAFLEKHNLSKTNLNTTEYMRVVHELETAKKALSQRPEYEIELILKSKRYSWTLTRELFARICSKLLHRIQVPIERTLSDTEIALTDIDEVVLVGGATRMHCFRLLVSRIFHRLPLSNVDPDLAVALGAGIQAGLKAKSVELKDIVLTDVSPYSLGTGIVNESDSDKTQGDIFVPIIERNTKLPTTVEYKFNTVYDNQTKIEIGIYQGESKLVKHNLLLGSIEINVPKNKAGREAVTVKYHYDLNGILDIDVTVHSTGQKYSKSIVNSANSLSKSELDASRKKLAGLKFHPRDSEENRALIARAERLLGSTMGEKRDHISELISEFNVILESQKTQNITRAVKAFKQKLDEIEKTGID